jgi:hypothetical protein
MFCLRNLFHSSDDPGPPQIRLEGPSNVSAGTEWLGILVDPLLSREYYDFSGLYVVGYLSALHCALLRM